MLIAGLLSGLGVWAELCDSYWVSHGSDLISATVNFWLR